MLSPYFQILLLVHIFRLRKNIFEEKSWKNVDHKKYMASRGECIYSIQYIEDTSVIYTSRAIRAYKNVW